MSNANQSPINRAMVSPRDFHNTPLKLGENSWEKAVLAELNINAHS